eukprot:GGOE01014431.1.p1 GENE.GGOE01014431.1~~GGOE01014431.1.p1  ORF type:complete len:716 (+),score=253.77 GGOE01014431.1:28-2175(+)
MPWKGQGSDVEIRDNKLLESRPLLKIHYSRPRSFFVQRSADIKLSSRDAMECVTELRPFKDPTYELTQIEHEISIQAVPEAKDSSAQTAWFRKVDYAMQADPEAVDVRKDFGEAKAEEDVARIVELVPFLKRVFPRVEHNLIQNELVPIFSDDYTSIEDDDAFIGHKEESFLKENQSFVHHKFTKGKKISSIDWQPKGSKIIVVSLVEPAAFEDRLQLNRRVQKSMVVVWSFSDPLHPQLVLEAPHEVNVVRFNPNQPHLIVGGCMNGQVCLWDINKAQQALKQTKGKKMGRGPAAGSPNSTDADGSPAQEEAVSSSTDMSVISWMQLSKIEASHRRAVNDLCWLLDTQESNFDGKLSHSPDELTYQFASLSSDGYLNVWDIRKDNVRKDKLRKSQQEAARSPDGELPWIPLLHIQLNKMDGTGDVSGLRMQMSPKSIDPYRLCCTSEDGEFCLASWAPVEEKKEMQMTMDYGMQDRESRSAVKQVAHAHYGPAMGIQRHPSVELSDYYLTVGDWSFKIWRLGVLQPVVMSPAGSSCFTAARWSPTRPSILYIGTHDGYLQVWDLLERSHEPTIAQSIGPCAIVSLEFKPLHESRNRFGHQQLAVGDELGVLHVFDIPRVLIRPHANEQQNMERFLDRELKRVTYFAVRWKVRQQELEQLQARMEKEKVEAQLSAPVDGGLGSPMEPEEDNPFADELVFKESMLEFQKTLIDTDD